MLYTIKGSENAIYARRISDTYYNLIDELRRVAFAKGNKTEDLFEGFLRFAKEKKYVVNINPERLNKSSTFEETHLSIKINGKFFSKGEMQRFFRKGVSVEGVCEKFPTFEIRKGNVYLKTSDGKEINTYYFDLVLDEREEMTDFILNNSTSNTSYTVNCGDNEIKEGIMNNTITNILEMNKEAGKQAAIIKVGKTANKAVVDILTTKVLPKKYVKLATQPLIGLLLANISAVALKQLSDGKSNSDKINAVADSMILSSMIDITNIIDINEMISEVLAKVDLTELGFGKEK